MSLCARFFAINRQLCWAVEKKLSLTFTRHIQTLYKYEVAALLNRQPGQIVIDVGGGKECPFLPYVKDPRSHLVVAFDYSGEELRVNPLLGRKVVGDAAADRFPFRNGSADLVVSRAVVEHIRDNAAFFRNCAAALRPGGVMIHAFSGRFAPFALINQFLPNRLTRRLIGYLHPYWREEGNYGFPAFYNRCYFSAIQNLLKQNGFKNAKFTLLYYQSTYFTFFFPLFVLMLLYDVAVSRFGVRNLASGIIVEAERSHNSCRQIICDEGAVHAHAHAGETQSAKIAVSRGGGDDCTPRPSR
jgi:SAM-dependent methyltransferase